MICPECNEILKIPDNTKINIECYHRSVLSITECCGKIVTVHPVYSFTARKYKGNRQEDDWGREIVNK